MCYLCGPYVLNPAVAELWRKDFEKLDPEQKAFIERAADMLKEEIEKTNASTR